MYGNVWNISAKMLIYSNDFINGILRNFHKRHDWKKVFSFFPEGVLLLVLW
jgi:hypothetical protein